MTFLRRIPFIAIGLALAAPSASPPLRLSAQTPDAIRQQVRSWREANEAPILAELRELLAIPNNAADEVNIRRNADHLVAMLSRRGIRARLLEVEGSPPAVYGELPAPGATRTVVFYAHYDGQPVDPAKWASHPFQPVLRSRSLLEGGKEIPFPATGQRVDPEARIYGRSASDDKSPIVAMMAALDALQASGQTRSINLKFFLEGEEEAGSGHLRAMLSAHAESLRADAWLFFDGPVHQTRKPMVDFGVRGVMGLNLTVYGPLRPLHSGHYGNWAPNPNVLMAHLIASLRDPEGRILIPGYYDDVRPVTAAERAAIAGIPPADEQLRRELGLARTEADNALLNDRILLPALNVGGLSGGRTGAGGANLIGTETSAYIDLRLVPDQTPARVRQLVEAHLAKQGWHIVRDAPDSTIRRLHARIVKVDWSDAGYPAFRTPLDLPVSRVLVQTASEALGQPILELPTSGGSLGIYHFAEVLKVPLVFVPIVNHDNNQHGQDENLRLQNLWDGIELIAGIVARMGLNWRPTT
jgi:acetylornithine deacetylase/succinyl-diaminopimelate desuccinylase-like protein